MRQTIDTRFADSRAADLSLAYGLRPLPALGTHSVTLGGLTVELRVLGASHQVVLGDWSETVACLPEQVLGGYPSEDLVQWRGFVGAQWDALQQIRELLAV